MSEAPRKTVTRQQIMDATRALGYEPEDVFEITIQPNEVTVGLFWRTEDGARILVESEDTGRHGFAKRYETLAVDYLAEMDEVFDPSPEWRKAALDELSRMGQEEFNQHEDGAK